MGEIVGVFYNKDKVAAAADDARRLRGAAGGGQGRGRRRRSCSATSTSGRASTSTRPCRASTPTSRRCATSCSPRTARRSTRRSSRQAATKLQEWAKKGYFKQDFNGTGYDPAWQQFAKGKGPFLIAGTWLTADLAEAMGDKVGFMLMPRRGAGDPVSLGGESLPFAITSKSKNPDVAAAYIDFLTDANAAKVLVDTDNLPAMKADAAPPAACRQRRRAAWKKLNEADGLIPYLDYATPTFYDDISGGDPGAAGRQAGRRARSRRACRRTTRSSRSRSVSSDATARARRGGARGRASAARRAAAGRLPVPAAGVRRLRGFVLLPLMHAAWISLFDWDGDHAGRLGRARQLHGGRHATRSCARRSCTRWCCWSSTRCCRS